jgi:hypothetical protein
METRVFSKSWFSFIISYSILGWTVICIVGTWFIILKYGILLKGLIAVVTTFFFAAAIWGIPLTGFILLSLWVTPEEDNPSYVLFKEMIKKGMRRNSG